MILSPWPASLVESVNFRFSGAVEGVLNINDCLRKVRNKI